MADSVAAIAGGIGGVVALLAVVILLVFGYKYCYKSSSNKNSDTASSDPSALEFKRGGLSSSVALPHRPQDGARHFSMEELEQATRYFDETSLIGIGSFGLVFKGLLSDGTVVAIKRRSGAHRQEFVEEVEHLFRIQHRHLVTLLGYCQENGYQILVFEYLPNGSMHNHLYDRGKDSARKLEFKQRLSIAVGAAKGLCHLHSQHPPFVHGNFKTANVLVDEDFISTVADAGISNLLDKIEDAGPSSSSSSSAFRDPEVGQSGILSEASDVYAFGVFLMELLTGMEASRVDAFGSNESMLQWVEKHLISNDLVDHRLVGSFTAEGMRDFIKLAIRCTRFPGKERPTMERVVLELDHILEKEIMRTSVMGEGTASVTLGSQLFTN